MRSAGPDINAPRGTMSKSRQTSDTKARPLDIQHVLGLIQRLFFTSATQIQVLSNHCMTSLPCPFSGDS
jgi:hypothetical protein